MAGAFVMGGKGMEMMTKEQLQIILTHDFSKPGLLDEQEKEVALKILDNLKGTVVIRATSILEFCLKAIQHSVV